MSSSAPPTPLAAAAPPLFLSSPPPPFAKFLHTALMLLFKLYVGEGTSDLSSHPLYKRVILIRGHALSKDPEFGQFGTTPL